MTDDADVEVLTVAAHDRSYRVYADTNPLAGQAAGKVTACARDGRPYEHPLLNHIHTLGLPAGSVAVDVGANVGGHSLWLAAVCRLRVHAFEPLVADQCRANVALNPHCTVDVHRIALGREYGIADHVGDGRLQPDGDKRTHEFGVSAAVVPLDTYHLTGVSVVKIDVEGMEPDVIAGAAATLTRERPVVFAEEWDDHPKWHDRIAAELAPLGYDMVRLWHGKGQATPVGEWHPQ